MAFLIAIHPQNPQPRLVRQAIEAVWEELIATGPGEAEWSRACHLVANSYRFGLESPAAVAAVVGNNHLWGRRQDLGAPLLELDRWTPARLREEALPLLDPARAFVLEAVPA